MLVLHPGLSLEWFPNQVVTPRQHRIKDSHLTQDKALFLAHTGGCVPLASIRMDNPAPVQFMHSIHLVQYHLSINPPEDIIHINLEVLDNKLYLLA